MVDRILRPSTIRERHGRVGAFGTGSGGGAAAWRTCLPPLSSSLPWSQPQPQPLPLSGNPAWQQKRQHQEDGITVRKADRNDVACPTLGSSCVLAPPSTIPDPRITEMSCPCLHSEQLVTYIMVRGFNLGLVARVELRLTEDSYPTWTPVEFVVNNDTSLTLTIPRLWVPRPIEGYLCFWTAFSSFHCPIPILPHCASCTERDESTTCIVTETIETSSSSSSKSSCSSASTRSCHQCGGSVSNVSDVNSGSTNGQASSSNSDGDMVERCERCCCSCSHTTTTDKSQQ